MCMLFLSSKENMEERLGISREEKTKERLDRKKKERLDRDYPAGYRFWPTDLEIIRDYLVKKNLGQPLPPNIIGEVELYNHSPDDLIREHLTMHGTERDAGGYHFGLWDKKGVDAHGVRCLFDVYIRVGPTKALTHLLTGPSRADVKKDCLSSRRNKECYFFTSRDGKYKKGYRPNRDAGNGFWKATGADNPIIDENGADTGWVKKSLVYYRGNHKASEKSNWIMHEYRLKESPEPVVRTDDNMRLDGWVLCRIYEKNEKKDISDNLNEVQNDERNAVISNEEQDDEANSITSNNDNFMEFIDFSANCIEDGGEHPQSNAGLMTAAVNPISAIPSCSYRPENDLLFNVYSGEDEYLMYILNSPTKPPSQNLPPLDQQPELINSLTESQALGSHDSLTESQAIGSHDSLTESQALGSHDRNQVPRGSNKWTSNGLFGVFQRTFRTHGAKKEEPKSL